MKHTRLIPCLLLICMMACQPAQTKTSPKKDSLSVIKENIVLEETDTADHEEADDEYADAWVVVADTSHDYYALRDLLVQVHEKTGQKIDSLGRHYDAKKDSILTPEDDEDEVWAGAYYPRQAFADILSVEYVSLYRYEENYEGNAMAAVLGIYEQASTADSILQKVKPQFGNAHVIKTTVYLGCMH